MGGLSYGISRSNIRSGDLIAISRSNLWSVAWITNSISRWNIPNADPITNSSYRSNIGSADRIFDLLIELVIWSRDQIFDLIFRSYTRSWDTYLMCRLNIRPWETNSMCRSNIHFERVIQFKIRFGNSICRLDIRPSDRIWFVWYFLLN